MPPLIEKFRMSSGPHPHSSTVRSGLVLLDMNQTMESNTMKSNTRTKKPRRVIQAAVLAVVLLFTAFGSGAEAVQSPRTETVSVPDGSTRYVSMTITNTDGVWSCPNISSVVQIQLTSVNSGGFTIDAMRVFDGSGNGAAIGMVSTASGFYSPNSHDAGPWRWSNWNYAFNDRLSWSQPNINVSVTTPGYPWHCSQSRTLTLRPV